MFHARAVRPLISLLAIVLIPLAATRAPSPEVDDTATGDTASDPIGDTDDDSVGPEDQWEAHR